MPFTCEDYTQNWPRPAVSMAVCRRDEILLVQRSQGEVAGCWSFPGGHVEFGEAASAAATREVFEETGVQVDIGPVVDVHDVILYDKAGNLSRHYVLSIYCGLWKAGEPTAASDASAARFVRLEELPAYTLTHGLESYAARAAHILFCSGHA